MIDPTGAVTATQHDLLVATREPIYGPGTEHQEVITDPLHRVTTYQFDDLGRVSRVTDADQGVTRIEYNLLGSVQKVISKETVYVCPLQSLKAREVAAILRALGFDEIRQRGSHKRSRTRNERPVPDARGARSFAFLSRDARQRELARRLGFETP